MRKFILPIINLINVVLVSIAFGLSGKSAVLNGDSVGDGNFYQIVWGGEKANIVGIVAFFLLVVAAFLMLVNFLPLRGRKCVAGLTGLMFVATGVLMILCPNPKFYDHAYKISYSLTGSYIAMIVLLFIAGALSILMSVIEITGKKESK